METAHVAGPSLLNKRQLSHFHRQLHAWYKAHGRTTLPWRNTDDAYAIYISEVMLQQTQVATVLERFYKPFLTRFPTLKALAQSEREEVLHAWQGLGYYSRAANLHKAAQACGGTLPKTVEELILLPGIGKNTAHAICAFAYHQGVPVMEANLKRVLARIFALPQAKDNELWELAEHLLNRDAPFDYNQAMMDLGALTCTKSKPKCSTCPATDICQGKNSPELYPSPKQKKQAPVRTKRIFLLINDKGQIHATPRTTRFLGGLYHFSEKEENAPTGGARKLGNISQTYSHFTLQAEIFLKPSKGSGKDWHGANALASLPVSGAEKKILALLATYQGAKP